jgi:hypothetical protein
MLGASLVKVEASERSRGDFGQKLCRGYMEV